VRGAMTMMCNLGSGPAMLDNPRRLPLLLASRGDVEVTGDEILLPPGTLAVLSSEQSQ
jgi:hypothetical protein